MSAGCAGCGSCCDPVTLDADVFLAATRRARMQERPDAEDVFIARHWHPVGSWKATDGTQCISVRCDVFDPETRLCGAYGDRPPVCSRFPWYGREPGAGALPAYPHCSFLADLRPADRPAGSRPLIPLTVITSREAP